MLMMNADSSEGDETSSGESGSDEPAYTYESLSAHTKAELLEIAGELGVTGVSSSNLKDEIIEAILGAV